MKAKTVIILPEMIDPEGDFMSTFGQREPELAAKSIVIFCQLLGDWLPFTKDQIKRVYYQTKRGTDFDECFDLLVENDFLIPTGDYFEVTPEFVRRCYARHPARNSFFSK